MRKMATTNSFTSDHDDEVTQTQIVMGQGGQWQPQARAPRPTRLPVEYAVRTGRPGPSGGRPQRGRRSAF